MPAGDLVVSDYQLELRGVLMGADTHFIIDPDGGAVGGLFDDSARLSETPYAHADGVFVGDSTRSANTVTVALIVSGTDAADAGDGLEVMLATWASGSEEELWFQIPGLGKGYVTGWPLGIIPDLTRIASGIVPVLASFRAADPAATFSP